MEFRQPTVGKMNHKNRDIDQNIALPVFVPPSKIYSNKNFES